jgi:hypothetical protein
VMYHGKPAAHFEQLCLGGPVAFLQETGFLSGTPSPRCGARRMAGTAALLTNDVIPDVPMRQWVISSLDSRFTAMLYQDTKNMERTAMIRTLLRSMCLVALLQGGMAWAIPITGANIVTVGANEWAQPDLFTNLSWNAINAVCPTPSGSSTTGTLNGWDMQGWTWASVQEVDDLFNIYLAAAGVTEPNQLTGPDIFIQTKSTWAPLFSGPDGFRPTYADDFKSIVFGFSNETAGRDTVAYSPYIRDFYGIGGDVTPDEAVTRHVNLKRPTNAIIGAWLYRTPPTDVPSPGTVLLLSLGFAGLVVSRHKRRQ